MSLEHLRILALEARMRLEEELFGPETFDDQPAEPARKRVRRTKEVIDVANLRRSVRVMDQVDESKSLDPRARRSAASLKRRTVYTSLDDATAAAADAEPATVRRQGNGPRLAVASHEDSSRVLLAQLDEMKILFLGRTIPVGYAPSGSCKAAVMHAVCGRGPLGTGKVVRFNKYAGAQPFKNAYVLFINMFSPNGGNLNKIFDECISWYAPDSAMEDSRVVQELSNPSMRVSVVVRLEKDKEYVFLGDVKLVKIYPRSSPVRIDWKLMDYNELKHTTLFQKVERAGR